MCIRIPVKIVYAWKIVALVAGHDEGATASIDKEIVKLSGKESERYLFRLPSDDGYRLSSKIYGEKLGCKTDELLLLKNPPSLSISRKKIKGADIIYVGGGNTLMMMRRWRFLGIDRLLMKAHAAGKVMAGTSAGAICWFQYGHSDSEFYYHPEDWNWIRVKCLGILPFTACPHCLKEGRVDHFKNMMKKQGGIGIALDDCTAIEVVGDQFRILRSKDGAQAFRVNKMKGQVVTEPFPITDKLQFLKILNIEN